MNLGCGSDVPQCKNCKYHSYCALAFRTLTMNDFFNTVILLAIFLASGLVGASTYTFEEDWVNIIVLSLDEIVMGIFMAEVIVKILAEGKQPWQYFVHLHPDVRTFCRAQRCTYRMSATPVLAPVADAASGGEAATGDSGDAEVETAPQTGTVVRLKMFVCFPCCCCDPASPFDRIDAHAEHLGWKNIGTIAKPDWWNLFDCSIVVIALLPFGGDAVTVLRLIRLLRVLKMVKAIPRLRILVLGLIKSLSSIVYIGLLLGLIFYAFAVLGTSLFGANDPIHMGNLHITIVSLFRTATLEDWSDIMYIAMDGCDEYGYTNNAGDELLCVAPKKQPIYAIIYFCGFVVVSAMVILNLFIGVITSSMEDAKTALTEEMLQDKMDANEAEEM
tara:strand:- start:404 stop:1567 length:1164 start_codon:yes stop_codon:yes gene_type:complete